MARDSTRNSGDDLTADDCVVKIHRALRAIHNVDEERFGDEWCAREASAAFSCYMGEDIDGLQGKAIFLEERYRLALEDAAVFDSNTQVPMSKTELRELVHEYVKDICGGGNM